MADIFKYPGGKDLCKQMDDPTGVVYSLQDKSQNTFYRVPLARAKELQPQHAENVKRPRFGHDY